MPRHLPSAWTAQKRASHHEQHGQDVARKDAELKANEEAELRAKEALISRVKDFQKRGPAQKGLWYAFCGSDRDPARHAAGDLGEFVAIVDA